MHESLNFKENKSNVINVLPDLTPEKYMRTENLLNTCFNALCYEDALFVVLSVLI